MTTFNINETKGWKTRLHICLNLCIIYVNSQHMYILVAKLYLLISLNCYDVQPQHSYEH